MPRRHTQLCLCRCGSSLHSTGGPTNRAKETPVHAHEGALIWYLCSQASSLCSAWALLALTMSPECTWCGVQAAYAGCMSFGKERRQ